MLIFMLNRPFFAYQRTKTFLCSSGLFMHTSAHVNFYACQAFLCYRGRVAPNHGYHCGKKMKSIYLEMTVFWATVCPV